MHTAPLMSNKHTTLMASLVSAPAHEILLIQILTVKLRTTVVHQMMTLKSLRTLPGRLCLRQWILPGLGLWILKRLFAVPCNIGMELISKLTDAFDPSTQQARDAECANHSLKNAQFLSLSQKLCDVTATIESLCNQNSMLQLQNHETDWACNQAELKLEMFEMTTHHPPPICCS